MPKITIEFEGIEAPVMVTLYAFKDPVSIEQIAKAIGSTDQGIITQTLKKLEDYGLVYSQDHEWMLTQAGLVITFQNQSSMDQAFQKMQKEQK
jgi:predicted transcriptional regulator